MWRCQKASGRRYAVTLTAFALGLMAKPMLVSLPFVLLLMDYWPLGRTGIRRLIVEKLPFLALSGVAGALTLWAQNASGAVVKLDSATVGQRLAQRGGEHDLLHRQGRIPNEPRDVLSPPRTRHPDLASRGRGRRNRGGVRDSDSVPETQTRGHRGLVLVSHYVDPVIGIVQVGSQGMADRYTYVPLIGLFIAGTWLAADGFAYCQGRFKSALLTAPAKAVLALMMLAGLSVTTYYQVGYWRSSMALAKHAVEVTKDNYLCACHVGMALRKAHRNDEAWTIASRRYARIARIRRATTKLGSCWRQGDCSPARWRICVSP